MLRKPQPTRLTCLTIVAPFPEAILVEHVSTDRLVAVRDPSPPMNDDTLKRRHVWMPAAATNIPA
jgi:hypothetical protein